MRPLLFFLLLFCTAGWKPASSQDLPIFSGGIVFEHNSSFQPGAEVFWQASRHTRLGVSWTTTRLATAWGSNDLVKDRVQVHMQRHLVPHWSVHPFARISLGYERFDREDDVLFALLDNDALTLAFRLGLEGRAGPVRLFADGGFHALTASTVYPVVTSFGLLFPLRPW